VPGMARTVTALQRLLRALRARRAPGAADEPLLEDAEQRQELLKRIAAGIAANKFPPR
jgi:hypothetical protein